MRTVNVQEAKTHLLRLTAYVAAGGPLLIAKAGRALVKVMPIDAAETGAKRRLGFLAGQADVLDDFDRMGAAEIGGMFKGDV